MSMGQDHDELLKLEGYDDAILGNADVWTIGGERICRLVYSADLIIELLVFRDKMSVEDAVEFIEFNIEGAYMGPQTPVIVWDTAY